MTIGSSTRLRKSELASLFRVGHLPVVNTPPPDIPTEHQARLIALGYIVNLLGRLRMTSLGRALLAAEEQRVR